MLGARHLSSRSRNTLPEDRIEYNGGGCDSVECVLEKDKGRERERERERKNGARRAAHLDTEERELEWGKGKRETQRVSECVHVENRKRP